MKILILEDSIERIKYFRIKFKDDILLITKSTKQAISWLNGIEFDAIYLDHDLGDEVFQKSEEGTGYEVAVWMEQNPSKQPPKIVLHSMNWVGVNNMKKALPNAVVQKCAWLPDKTRDEMIILPRR